MRRAALVAAALVAAGPALAEGPADRYALEVVEGGVVRLDRQTGAMEVCRREADVWSCRPVSAASDSGAAADADLSAENARLRDEVAALKRRLAEIAAFANAAAGDDGAAAAAPPAEADVRAEIDQVFDVTEHAIRRFMDLVERMSAEVE